MFLPISQHGILVWTIEPRVIGKRALEHQSPKTTFILLCKTPRVLLAFFGERDIIHWQNLSLPVGMWLFLSCPAQWAAPGTGAPQQARTELLPAPCICALRCVTQQVAGVPSTCPWDTEGWILAFLAVPAACYSQDVLSGCTAHRPCQQHFPRKHWETTLSWNYNGNIMLG